MTRAERKHARRELSAWLGARGLAPAGEVWRLAWDEGCRDLDTLARAAAECGALRKLTPDGVRMPAGLRDGVTLPDGSRVIGAPAIDVDTATVWVCVADADGVTRDIEIGALTPIPRTESNGRSTTRARTSARTSNRTEPNTPVSAGEARPARTAPEWVREAAAEYRGARDAWERSFEEETHQTYTPGCIQRERRREARGGRREVTDYVESNPPPMYRDHLTAAAARRRDGAPA